MVLYVAKSVWNGRESLHLEQKKWKNYLIPTESNIVNVMFYFEKLLD